MCVTLSLDYCLNTTGTDAMKSYGFQRNEMRTLHTLLTKIIQAYPILKSNDDQTESVW